MVLRRLQDLFYRVLEVLVHFPIDDWASNAVA